MGNAHGSLDLLCLRALTVADVNIIQDAFRRQRPALAVDRSTFETLFDEDTVCDALRVFDKLDVDCDRKIDTFEMLMTVTLWCCASWKEKACLLFTCFDFNCKGGLHFPELTLMVATAARVASCFAESLPPWVSSSSELQELAAAAFGLKVPPSNANQPSENRLVEEAFGRWFESSDAAQQLRGFVEASLKHAAPEAADAELREQVRMLDWRVQELAKELLRLREIAATFRSEDEAEGELPAQQQQRLQPLWKRLDGIFNLLDIALDTQQRELRELAAAQNRDAAGPTGAAALLAPAARAEHRQLMEAVSGLEHKARSYLDDAQGVLGEIVEVRRAGDLDSRPNSPPEPQTSPTRTTQPGRVAAALQRPNRLLDRDARRRRGRQPVVDSTGTNAGAQEQMLQLEDALQFKQFDASSRQLAITDPTHEAAEEPQNLVVVFTDFDPPKGSDTPMLQLRQGDVILPLGKDEQGWWYGRQQRDGKEGWFPPAYVRSKDEVAAPPH